MSKGVMTILFSPLILSLALLFSYCASARVHIEKFHSHSTNGVPIAKRQVELEDPETNSESGEVITHRSEPITAAADHGRGSAEFIDGELFNAESFDLIVQAGSLRGLSSGKVWGVWSSSAHNGLLEGLLQGCDARLKNKNEQKEKRKKKKKDAGQPVDPNDDVELLSEGFTIQGIVSDIPNEGKTLLYSHILQMMMQGKHFPSRNPKPPPLGLTGRFIGGSSPCTAHTILFDSTNTVKRGNRGEQRFSKQIGGSDAIVGVADVVFAMVDASRPLEERKQYIANLIEDIVATTKVSPRNRSTTFSEDDTNSHDDGSLPLAKVPQLYVVHNFKDLTVPGLDRDPSSRARTEETLSREILQAFDAQPIELSEQQKKVQSRFTETLVHAEGLAPEDGDSLLRLYESSSSSSSFPSSSFTYRHAVFYNDKTSNQHNLGVANLLVKTRKAHGEQQQEEQGQDGEESVVSMSDVKKKRKKKNKKSKISRQGRVVFEMLHQYKKAIATKVLRQERVSSEEAEEGKDQQLVAKAGAVKWTQKRGAQKLENPKLLESFRLSESYSIALRPPSNGRLYVFDEKEDVSSPLPESSKEVKSSSQNNDRREEL